MKRVSAVLLVTGLCLFQACGNNTGKEDTVDSAKDANEQKDTSSMMSSNDTTSTATSSMPVDKDAADFAVEAANGGMMEVQLGQIAQDKAMSQRVKDFGAMMVKDHSAANDELKSLASSKNITLPASISNDAQKDIDDLNKKSGKDFDKAYMSMMLDDHKKDVKKFEKVAKDCKDPDIKSFATKTLPVLLVHLDSAKAITGKKS